MKLRDLRYAAAPSWPPTWPTWTGTGASPGPSDGVLAAVYLRRGIDGLVIERSFGGHLQQGRLLWDGRPDPATLLDRLTAAVGQPIADLDALEV